MYFFRQITTFIKVRVTFVFRLQTLWMIDFSKIYGLKHLKPINKGNTNFYECCDLTKKVYLIYIYIYCACMKYYSVLLVIHCETSQFFSHPSLLPLFKANWSRTCSRGYCWRDCRHEGRRRCKVRITAGCLFGLAGWT